jgi:hypothetical protein
MLVRRKRSCGQPMKPDANLTPSHALAGNLLSLLKWWLDHGAKESPRAMDQLFHGIAWRGLQKGALK